MNTERSSGSNVVFSEKKTERESPRASYLAVASLSCLILVGLCAIVLLFKNLKILDLVASFLLPTSFALGVMGAFAIWRHKYLKGTGYVIAPIILGGGFILLVGLGEFRLKNRAYAEKYYSAIYDMKKLREVMLGYAKYNNGYLPSSDKWCDMLMGFDKSVSPSDFNHPKIEGRVIGFNKNLGGMQLEDIPENIVLLFEANGGWNLVGDEELLQKQKNDLDYFVKTILVNGGVKSYWLDPNTHSTSEKPLRWKP